MYRSIVCSLICWSAIGVAVGAEPAVRRVECDPQLGTSAAVLVDDLPLVYTAQFLPSNDGPPAQADDEQASAEHTASQVRSVLDHLDQTLAGVSESCEWLRLHFYLTSESFRPIVESELARRFPGESAPAVTFVVTALPQAHAKVAADGVAAIVKGEAPCKEQVLRRGTAVQPHPIASPGSAAVTIAPAGQRVYISGQAEPGALAEATRRTLAGLQKTLEEYHLTLEHAVQVKCFLNPMAQSAMVVREIATFFGDQLPAVAFVEWTSAGNSPIEIELVAWGGPARDEGPLVEYLTPQGMQASPVFCRVTRVRRGGSVFLSDLFGPPGLEPEVELTAAFTRLGQLLKKTGSDWKHLAKATYYVTNAEVNASHNRLRTQYYDPARPPAASKAPVTAIGRAQRSYVMDMIAVPSSEGTPLTGPEVGYGLNAEQAAAGWICLFDGASTFGWKQAAMTDDGGLRGGETTARIGPGQLVLHLAAAGTAQIAGESRELPAGEQVIELTKPTILRLTEQTVARRIRLLPQGLQSLLPADDLSDWKPLAHPRRSQPNPARWTLENGVLRIEGGPSALEYLPRTFENFVLQIDVRTRAVHSNGGVFLRSIAGDFMNGYEIQLHNRCRGNDPARPFTYCTGGIDDRQDARRMVARDFCTFRMTVMADGPHWAAWVNGHQTADWTDDRPLHDNPRQGRRLHAGTLQLQAHDPETDYEVRALRILPWE